MSEETLREIRDLPLLQPRQEEWDDHRCIARSREAGPAARDGRGAVAIFSYADLLQAVDPRATRPAGPEVFGDEAPAAGPLAEFYRNSVFFAYGERHRARRAPLARAFGHPALRTLRPKAATISEALISPFVGGGEIDFVNAVCAPLPAQMIAVLLGLPENDIARFTRLIHSATRATALPPDPEMAEALRGLAELETYAGDLLDARRERPRDDFLTHFLSRTEDFDLDEAEIRWQVASLCLAGTDAVRVALACTTARLLQHPEQWRTLAAHPERAKAAAAAEGLRFDPPVGALPRIAIAEFEVAGVRVPEGQLIFASLLGALRDPEVYDAPDRFDIGRTDHPRRHPVFGEGVHRCLGETLALVQLEEALSALARLAPEMELVGDAPVLEGLNGPRRLGSMRVRL